MVLALPVECRAPPLETNTRPPLQLNTVGRPTRTAADQDQHPGSDQLLPDTGSRAGVPPAGRDAGREPGCRRGRWRSREARRLTRRDYVSRPPIGSLCRVRPRRGSPCPAASNTYLIKPSMKRTAGCLTILAAPRAGSWRKSKLAILSVTLHHHPQGQKVHLPRAGY